jgi:16S rRNA G966 N2-methylase RsmD
MSKIQNNLINNILQKYINKNCELEFYIKKDIVQDELALTKKDYDPWEESMNDNKFYIYNKISRIFPSLKNQSNYEKIKIDDDSFCYITIREIAEVTSKIISYHLLELNLNPQKIVITDYTSGVGGNVLSFCKYFNFVHAVELSKERSEFLKNNLDVYEYKNYMVHNKCAIEFNNNDLLVYNPNVIFIDPPWGGISYKENDNLLLNLGPITIENLILDIFNKFSMNYSELTKIKPKEKNNNYNSKIIILKLPKNYNIEFFYNSIKKNNINNYVVKMNLYILNKMLILIIQLINS